VVQCALILAPITFDSSAQFVYYDRLKSLTSVLAVIKIISTKNYLGENEIGTRTGSLVLTVTETITGVHRHQSVYIKENTCT